MTGDRRRIRRFNYADGTEHITEAVYRKPALDKYPPGYPHRVVITESTRHGRAKRHVFTRRFPANAGTERWRPETPGTAKEVAESQRQFPPGKPMPPGLFGAQRQASLGIPANKPIQADTTVHLADGVDMPATTLVFILDACASIARHQIDVADIKTIVSQLGSRIAQAEALPAETRQLAEPALYAEILRRCTNIGPVSNN